MTCPAGQTTRYFRRNRDDQGRPIKRFWFDRADCQVCPLFARCVHSSSYGRTITIHYHEALFQDARRKQKTDDFDEAYSLRSEVERKIAELMRHGLRQTRYIGTPKTALQGYWTAAAVNLKRLFKLFDGNILACNKSWGCSIERG